jgi:tetratricopeptide (TPR) repeat protein
MSETHRSDQADTDAVASGADRDAKIEQLLLVGLDHYFANRYELAINVWTRALFLDRSHARARAYIDRARRAQAERQRESEELLQNGVSAFQRGEAGEARRLLEAAIEGGAPSDEALVVLERLNRLETALAPESRDATARGKRSRASDVHASLTRGRSAMRLVAVALLVLMAVAALVLAAVSSGRVDVQSLLALAGAETSPVANTGVPVRREVALALPHRGEMTLTRARALNASGHLREALSALESIRATDPQKADADRLRADIQRQLLALTVVPAPVGADREKGDRRLP